MELNFLGDNFIEVARRETVRMMTEKGILRSDIALNPSTPIQELELSTRLKNLLLSNGYNKVSDLEELTTLVLLRTKGFGDKLIVEIQDFQYKYRITEFNKF